MPLGRSPTSIPLLRIARMSLSSEQIDSLIGRVESLLSQVQVHTGKYNTTRVSGRKRGIFRFTRDTFLTYCRLLYDILLFGTVARTPHLSHQMTVVARNSPQMRAYAPLSIEFDLHGAPTGFAFSPRQHFVIAIFVAKTLHHNGGFIHARDGSVLSHADVGRVLDMSIAVRFHRTTTSRRDLMVDPHGGSHLFFPHLLIDPYGLVEIYTSMFEAFCEAAGVPCTPDASLSLRGDPTMSGTLSTDDIAAILRDPKAYLLTEVIVAGDMQPDTPVHQLRIDSFLDADAIFKRNIRFIGSTKTSHKLIMRVAQPGDAVTIEEFQLYLTAAHVTFAGRPHVKLFYGLTAPGQGGITVLGDTDSFLNNCLWASPFDIGNSPPLVLNLRPERWAKVTQYPEAVGRRLKHLDFAFKAGNVLDQDDNVVFGMAERRHLVPGEAGGGGSVEPRPHMMLSTHSHIRRFLSCATDGRQRCEVSAQFKRTTDATAAAMHFGRRGRTDRSHRRYQHECYEVQPLSINESRGREILAEFWPSLSHVVGPSLVQHWLSSLEVTGLDFYRRTVAKPDTQQGVATYAIHILLRRPPFSVYPLSPCCIKKASDHTTAQTMQKTREMWERGSPFPTAVSTFGSHNSAHPTLVLRQASSGTAEPMLWEAYISCTCQHENGCLHRDPLRIPLSQKQARATELVRQVERELSNTRIAPLFVDLVISVAHQLPREERTWERGGTRHNRAQERWTAVPVFFLTPGDREALGILFAPNGIADPTYDVDIGCIHREKITLYLRQRTPEGEAPKVIRFGSRQHASGEIVFFHTCQTQPSAAHIEHYLELFSSIAERAERDGIFDAPPDLLTRFQHTLEKPRVLETLLEGKRITLKFPVYGSDIHMVCELLGVEHVQGHVLFNISLEPRVTLKIDSSVNKTKQQKITLQNTSIRCTQQVKMTSVNKARLLRILQTIEAVGADQVPATQ